ncbi:hypothetical protein [Streptomyces antioxidans]|nr:hypothetical protein [Streptomyces antioxidans]
MKTKQFLKAAVIAAAAATCAAVTASPSSAAEGSDVSTKAWRGYVVACETQGDTANFKYDPDDNASTTVYYNNHCGHDVNVAINISDGTKKCIAANANTKSKKYLYVGGEHIDKLTRGC